MISIRLLAIVFITLLCRQLTLQVWHAEASSQAWIIGIGLPLGFGLFVKAAAMSSIALCYARNDGSPTAASVRSIAWKRFHFLRSVAEFSWLALLPVLLLLGGWLAMLECWTESGCPKTLTLLAAFAPSLIVIIFFEWTAAQLDELLQDSSSCPGSSSQDRASWPSLFLMRIRLGDFASLLTCLTPVFFIFAFRDLLTWTRLNVAEPWLTLGACLVGLFTFSALFPLLLSLWAGAKPIEDTDSISLSFTPILSSLKIRGLRLLRIPSSNRWAGAAVLGMLPATRRLWLSDRLIDRLTPRELDMVIFHELAHIKRQHLTQRLFPIITWASVGCLGWWLLEFANPFLPTHLLLSLQVALLSFLGFISFHALGCKARQLEFDADESAVALAVEHTDWASNAKAAALELATALEALTVAADRRRASWLHPSINERIAVLSRLQ